ncbi:MAG: dTDP-4-dehydrorhamnose reductase [Phycisphaera sp.]|nr:dTDP-4-dehydrorhamnose reductase [Phycisphaera sp.]
MARHPTDHVLLIGASGMLAHAWIKLMDERGIRHTDVDIPDFDLTREPSIVKHVDERYTMVVNCAAFTDVDGCETKYALAEKINGTGVGDLAKRCKHVGALLVHYSTDYVFNGQATTPYTTDDTRDPINAYGKSKALGEELIEAVAGEHLIVRTSWLYAPWGKNFVLTIARLAREKPTLKVVNDQRGRPTSAEHLAATTLALVEKDARGIYHVTDGGECTWYEFAQKIVELAGAKCDVHPCTTAEFPRLAKRPAYSTLEIIRTEMKVGPMTPWKENLKSVMERVTGAGK